MSVCVNYRDLQKKISWKKDNRPVYPGPGSLHTPGSIKMGECLRKALGRRSTISRAPHLFGFGFRWRRIGHIPPSVAWDGCHRPALRSALCHPRTHEDRWREGCAFDGLEQVNPESANPRSSGRVKSRRSISQTLHIHWGGFRVNVVSGVNASRYGSTSLGCSHAC